MRITYLRSTVLAILAASAASTSAFGGALLQDGTAQAPAALGTYGMQTTLPVALHTILPKGWSLIVAPGLDLPGKVSWAPTDTWLDTLARIADRTDAGFLVDWNRHQLSVRSVADTSRAVETLEQARQAATVPLPSLAPAHLTPVATAATPTASSSNAPVVTPAAAPVPAVTAHSAVAVTTAAPAGPAAPAVAARPTAPVASPASIAAVAHQPPAVSADPTQSFSGVSIGTVLETLATHYQLHLEFNGPDFPLPGPVTLRLRGSLAEDIERVHRALGPVAPLAITSYASSRELVVERAPEFSYAALEARPAVAVSRSNLFARLTHFHTTPGTTSTSSVPVPASLPAAAPGATPVLTASNVAVKAPTVAIPTTAPTAPASAPAAAVVAPTATVPAPAHTAPVNTPTVAAVLPTAPAVVKATAPTMVFDIVAGERLSVALDRFLRAQGWQLSWQSLNDLQADEATHLTGQTVADILAQLLPALGLAQSVDASKHLIVVSQPTAASVNP